MHPDMLVDITLLLMEASRQETKVFAPINNLVTERIIKPKEQKLILSEFSNSYSFLFVWFYVPIKSLLLLVFDAPLISLCLTSL